VEGHRIRTVHAIPLPEEETPASIENSSQPRQENGD
jgi:hypothetical protein